MNIEASNKEIICYCFGHSVQDLRNDVLRNGHSLIMERIAAEKRLGDVTAPRQIRKGGDASPTFAV